MGVMHYISFAMTRAVHTECKCAANWQLPHRAQTTNRRTHCTLQVCLLMASRRACNPVTCPATHLPCLPTMSGGCGVGLTGLHVPAVWVDC